MKIETITTCPKCNRTHLLREDIGVNAQAWAHEYRFSCKDTNCGFVIIVNDKEWRPIT